MNKGSAGAGKRGRPTKTIKRPATRALVGTAGRITKLVEDVTDRKVLSEADIARLVERRIPMRAILKLKAIGFSDGEIDAFVLPARTRRHRIELAQPLTVEESDRAVRLLRLQAQAEKAFNNPDKARRWLRKPLTVLNGQTPLDFARTDAGARTVETILAKIAWGAAA